MDAYVLKDQIIMKSGIMNDVEYTKEELEKLVKRLKEEGGDKNKNSLFEDHEDGVCTWIGEIPIDTIKIEESEENVLIKGDLHIVDSNIIEKLKYQEDRGFVSWGISPTFEITQDGKRATNIIPKGFSLVLTPAGGEELMIKLTEDLDKESLKVFEEEYKQYDDTCKLENVEIFSIGTWNNDKYSEKDLDEIVANSKKLKTIDPPIRFGHEEEDLIKKSGLPSGGWVSNLKRVGQKLVADFVDMPKRVYELIKKKAYRKRSACIIWNFPDPKNGNNLGKVLHHVAYLGQEFPAVTNLEDVEALYYEDNRNYRIYFFEEGGLAMKEENLTTPEKDEKKESEEKLEGKIKDTEAGMMMTEGEFFEELSRLKGIIKSLQEEVNELKNTIKKNEVETYIEDLKFKGKYQPSWDEFVKPTLQGLPVNNETLKAYAEKDPIEIMKERERQYQENMKKLLESLPKVVTFAEQGVSNSEEKEKTAEEKIQEYADKLVKEQGLSYRDAVMEAARKI